MLALSPALIEGAAVGSPFAGPRSATAATDFAAARTSVSVTRPSGPVPFTLEISTPSSAAIRRATGDAFTRASSGFSIAGIRFWFLRFFFLFYFLFLRLLFFLFLFFGFRLFLFFFLLLLSWRFLAFTADERDFVANVYLAAFFHINFGERAVLGRFPFHGRLVSLDFGEHFAGGNLIALLFLPRDERALGHRVTQLGHLDFRHK